MKKYIFVLVLLLSGSNALAGTIACNTLSSTDRACYIHDFEVCEDTEIASQGASPQQAVGDCAQWNTQCYGGFNPIYVDRYLNIPVNMHPSDLTTPSQCYPFPPARMYKKN